MGQRAAVFAALWAAVAGCDPRVAPGAQLETSYNVAVARWTSSGELYQNGDQRAHFSATLESEVYREQRLRELAHLQAWAPAQVEAERQKQEAAEVAETSFIIGAYTEANRGNDLSDNRGIWRVVLTTPTGRVEPTKVENLGRPDENLIALYPYLDRYSKLYRAHFPKAASGPLTLTIASAVGQLALKFEKL